MIFPISAFAEIYQCESGGKIQFSDKPCGDDATVIEVETKETTNQVMDEQKVSGPSQIPDKPSIELKKSHGGGRVIAKPEPKI